MLQNNRIITIITRTITRKTISALFLFILMFSLFFYYREPGMFQHDMVEYAMYAEYLVLDDYDALYEPYFKEVLIHGFPWRTGTVYITVGIFYLLHFFGISSEFAAFFTQFVFGSLAVVILYLFLLELYQKHVAAITSALVFGLSAPIFNAVLSKEHGTEFFFAFLSMYLLLIGIKKRSSWFLFFSSVSLGFLLWMREGTLFFPVIYYVFFLININNENKELLSFRNILALFVPYILLASCAFYMYVWLLIKTALSVSNAPIFTYTKDILISVAAWYPLLYFIFVIAGLYFGFKRKEKFIMFFLFIALFFFVLFTKNETYDLRHLGIFIFFPFSVIICYAIVSLISFVPFMEKWNNNYNWKSLIILFFAGILIAQVFMPGVPLFEQRKEHIYTKEFAEGIASVIPREQGIIFMHKDFCLFILYYGKRNCAGLPVDFFSAVDATIASGSSVFVPYHAGFGFYSDEMKDAIEERYMLNLVYSGKFETFHHADLKPQIYDEMLVEVKRLEK